MTALYVGVDGGGTKCRAVVCGEDLAVRGAAESGGANPSSLPIERVVASVRAAVDRALGEAGLDRPAAGALAVGLAGVGEESLRAAVRDALEREYAPARVFLTTDARIALAGVDAERTGGAAVVVIAGTGSIAFGRNARGEEARAGGLGWLLGDEGSGFRIALEGLRALARSFDGRGSATMIGAILAEKGIASADDLAAAVRSAGVLPAGIAAHYPVVLRAAHGGDEVARAILAQAAAELADLALGAIRKLGLQGAQFPLAVQGGVFAAGEPLLAAMRARVLAEAPGARIGSPAFPPEIGAVRLLLEERR